ncbi:MAG: family 10 glycosylhydrolase [Prevotella sp.]|nr:family 10 glycosylhydrolase [Prevotella sp.]
MRTKITLIVAFLCLTIQAQKHEVRAVWLTTIGGIDWPKAKTADMQKREMTDILDQLKLVNINTVLIQTRVRASTIYHSQIEPFDMCLTGTHGRSPGYDPLRFIVDECHKRGMECHAWIVTIPVGKTSEQRFKDFKRKNPKLAVSIGQDGYMNPEDPQTGDYLARICTEVTRNYDIDGIHLDYIRYPETWKIKMSRQQARQNITNIVAKIHRAVKSLKPWVKLSCSPIGKSGDLSRYRSGGWNAYNAVCQDAQGWLREGLMDQLYPMMYFRGNNFYPFALDWQERSYGRTIVSGLGIYFLSPREGNWTLDDVTRELNFVRKNRIGHCYFRSKFLTDNTRGIYDFARQFDAAPALIPPMTWAWSQQPTAPTSLNVSRTQQADRISWSGAVDHSRAPYLLYNIYASTTPEVDTDEPHNLIATRLQASQIRVPHTSGQTLYYAVTAIDRYGNESQPTFSDLRQQPIRMVKAQTPTDTKIPPFYYDWSKKQQKKWLKRYKTTSF